ncbi:hypothetical protein [Dechloromonas sp. A34]|uniref:hypothetical protein n=1 Tax=Dechloromonas sp. A34 TaxID=447588 RepID=UPI002248B076|nr:hypothetical protein [Dechloromonas sp. A34]
MDTAPEISSPLKPEANVKSILEWLASAHERTRAEDAGQLYRQLLLLRETPVPTAQRIKLLDLLYAHIERTVNAELPQLHEVSLPISRKLRQRVKALLEALETLTQDYFNTLATLFHPEGEDTPRPPHVSLRRAMHAIAWQIRISHLIAAPTALGRWQQLHTAFCTARRLGLDALPGPRGGPSVQRIYTNVLLTAIAQPASFTSAELEFINDYIEHLPQQMELGVLPPRDGNAIFWIDLDKDFPAHALIRRIPAADTNVLYFSCEAIAREASRHHAELSKGTPASTLGLPAFADTHAGQAVLLRLTTLWGNPQKRRFPRRRQSYRANLCLGLENLWQLIKTPEANIETSEWMVTNESPDGYALMHMSGQTESLRIGDIVALHAARGRSEASPAWHVCVIRWAISENPEHVELGLQLIASRAIAARIVQPYELSTSPIEALILPEAPPLRPLESLVVASGVLKPNSDRLIVLVEAENFSVREVRTTHLDEQTSSIEVFSVSTDDSV